MGENACAFRLFHRREARPGPPLRWLLEESAEQQASNQQTIDQAAASLLNFK
jgi:hypothetical protein